MRIPDFFLPPGQWLWRHHPALLAALWVLVQLVFLRKFHGPHFANDSARYLEYAHNIAERGYFEPGHNLRYVLYPLFQSLWLRLGLGWGGIVAGQMLVSAAATSAVYRARGGWRTASAARRPWPRCCSSPGPIFSSSTFSCSRNRCLSAW